jgi:hypothetical protein
MSDLRAYCKLPDNERDGTPTPEKFEIKSAVLARRAEPTPKSNKMAGKPEGHFSKASKHAFATLKRNLNFGDVHRLRGIPSQRG